MASDTISVFVKPLSGDIIELRVDPSQGLKGVEQALTCMDPDAYTPSQFEVFFTTEEEKTKNELVDGIILGTIIRHTYYVYVVIMRSFKDPDQIYPEVFQHERDAVQYAYHELLEKSHFDHMKNKYSGKNEEDEKDRNENEYDLSKYDANDRFLPRAEIKAKYEPTTIQEFGGAIYMLRKLGFKRIYEFFGSMNNEGDRMCDVYKKEVL